MYQFFSPHLNVFSIQQMFCSRITYFIHIVFLYIEKSNMRKKLLCGENIEYVEETFGTWR